MDGRGGATRAVAHLERRGGDAAEPEFRGVEGGAVGVGLAGGEKI